MSQSKVVGVFQTGNAGKNLPSKKHSAIHLFILILGMSPNKVVGPYPSKVARPYPDRYI